MHFAGWTSPLQYYTEALEAAGMVMTSIKEPQPDTGAEWAHLEKWRKLPLFHWLKATPLP